MGCNCCSSSQQERTNLSLSSNMNMSINQETQIQEPPNSIRIKQSPKFNRIAFNTHMPSIEMKVSDPIAIDHVSINSTQNQLKTIQNILSVMNGKPDTIKADKKSETHSKKKARPKRIQMEDLEQLF